jgi:hypothetical protein
MVLARGWREGGKRLEHGTTKTSRHACREPCSHSVRAVPLALALGSVPGLCACSVREAAPPASEVSAPAGSDAVPIVQARRDFNGDGTEDTLAIYLASGRRVHDADPWCGAGDKYEGRFIVTVEVAGQRRSVDLNALFGSTDELWLWATPWAIAFDDYNSDGQLDFNLGQYASCNGWRYRLFTVTLGGEVSLLPVEPTDDVAVAAEESSTSRITTTPQGFEVEYYDSSRGGRVLASYVWDRRMDMFLLKQDIAVPAER